MYFPVLKIQIQIQIQIHKQIQIQKQIQTQLQIIFLVLLFHILENIHNLGSHFTIWLPGSKQAWIFIIIINVFLFVFDLDWIYVIRIVFTLPDITFYM